MIFQRFIPLFKNLVTSPFIAVSSLFHGIQPPPYTFFQWVDLLESRRSYSASSTARRGWLSPNILSWALFSGFSGSNAEQWHDTLHCKPILVGPVNSAFIKFITYASPTCIFFGSIRIRAIHHVRNTWKIWMIENQHLEVCNVKYIVYLSMSMSCYVILYPISNLK